MRNTIKNQWLLVLTVIMCAGILGCSSTPSKRSFGETVDDAVITNKLKVKFMKDKTVKAFKIDIDTWKGIVSLRGRVTGQDEVNRAIELSEQQPGVREVKSYLILKDKAYVVKKTKSKRGQVVEEKDITGKEVIEVKEEVVVDEVIDEKVQVGENEEFIDEGIPSVTP